jgi:hypothetical protein
MAVTINASTSTGLVQSADTSGIIQFQSNGSTKATLSSSGFSYAGGLLQVVSTLYTSSFSTTSTSLVDITNFNVVITPTATSSKILILVNINHANVSTGGFSNGFCVLRNGTAVGNGTLGTGSSPNFMIVNAPYAGNSAGVAVGQFLDSPSSTSALTYKVQTQCQSGTGTVYINQTGNLNGGTRPDQGGFTSAITVMEIAG